MMEAILLYTTVAMGPMPPEVEKTRGENVPCSTSFTRSSYALFFSCSFFIKAYEKASSVQLSQRDSRTLEAAQNKVLKHVEGDKAELI